MGGETKSVAASEEASGPCDVVEGGDSDESHEETETQLGLMNELVAAREETPNPVFEEKREPTKPRTWAMLADRSQTRCSLSRVRQVEESSEKSAAKGAVPASLDQMVLSMDSGAEGDVDGQFSDAEESGNEECDIDIRDPDGSNERCLAFSTLSTLEDELKSEFPSLVAARHVPYEGSDDEAACQGIDEQDAKRKADEERKRKSLQPVSKSGKLYNSFRNYETLMKPKPAVKRPSSPVGRSDKEKVEETRRDDDSGKKESRIIGGMALAGQDVDVEDDGEGWVATSKEIRSMKAAGALDPEKKPEGVANNSTVQARGPPIGQRAACATTDFAMQNVILQMNLELLSVDGMRVRKLKTWVTRCGACFKVYTSSENVGPLGSKRLFCERCGSDMMQRIAASVDGKTGRLRLHLSKKYKHNLRGTKFSLPKPGSGNRFQGDLLLREDQLLTGAWNQKVKMSSGGKARKANPCLEPILPQMSVATQSDIRVGFGRRNPNAGEGKRASWQEEKVFGQSLRPPSLLDICRRTRQ